MGFLDPKPPTAAGLQATFLSKAATRTLVVEDFFQAGDSDSQTWQRTIQAGVTGGGRCTILGTKSVYEFTAPVDIRGLVNAEITGLGKYSTVIKAKAGAGTLIAAFLSAAGASSAVVENLRFRKLRFDGGMTSVPAGHAREARVYGSDRIDAAAFISGNLVPTEAANPKINGVSFVECSFFGLEHLPIHIRGVDTVVTDDCDFERCLDPGWVHCRSVTATRNHNKWSADNGLSLSRGCTEVIATNNRIEGAYYAGIHAGGWAGEPGPKRAIIANNIVLNSGQYGISLLDGTSYSHVTGNIVDGVKRGINNWSSDSGSVQYGAGIIVGGVISDIAQQHTKAGYSTLATHNVVADNTVMNAERFGIVWFGAVDSEVICNQIYNIGSPTFVDGTTIDSANDWRNVGIGAYVPWGLSTSGFKVKLNYIKEDRGVAGGLNWGVVNSGTPDRFGNAIEGAKNVSIDIWGTETAAQQMLIGSSAATNAILTVRGSGGSIRSLLFQSGTTSDWSLRESATKGFEIFHYPTSRTPLKFAFDTGNMALDLPTKTGVAANVHIDTNGVAWKVI